MGERNMPNQLKEYYKKISKEILPSNELKSMYKEYVGYMSGDAVNEKKLAEAFSEYNYRLRRASGHIIKLSKLIEILLDMDDQMMNTRNKQIKKFKKWMQKISK
jgi:DNA polymerase III delta prime subunit